MYPDYLRVLRTVAAIALPIIAAAVAIASGLAGQDPVEVVLSAGAAVFGAGVQIAFWVTVAFVVVERSGTPAPSRGRTWTVAELPVPERARVGLGETVTGIVFSVLLIGVVLWPWTYVPSAGSTSVPVLSGDLRPEVTAFLVALLVAGIAARRINHKPRRVNVDFPAWMIASMDREADRLGISRQALIKVWIAERLERKAG